MRCVEPQKRMCGGTGPRWAVHRFRIKGGLPLSVVWVDGLREAVSKKSFFTRMLKAGAIQQLKAGDSK